jgi:hypothetical protein
MSMMPVRPPPASLIRETIMLLWTFRFVSEYGPYGPLPR